MCEFCARTFSLLSLCAFGMLNLQGFVYAQPANAPPVRAYVVSWVYYANASVDGDCPQGLNPSAEGLFRRILEERRTPPFERERLMQGFPYTMYDADIENRGSIDGKTVSAYLNPTSTKDPQLHLVQGRRGVGFNLDGKIGPDDFVDPETGEKGIDNEFYRVVGCNNQLRSPLGQRPTFPENQWDTMRDNMPAWLIEIRGLDNSENDADVEVVIMRARQPVVRDVRGAPQQDMTFTPEFLPRTEGNKVHGRIKGGVLTTDTFDFFMPGEPFGQAEYAFKAARMRFRIGADGSLTGMIGGYQKWRTIYTSWALGGAVFETLGFDIPGLYYALRKSADAYPDPKTGENTYISSAYAVEAVPAFIAYPASP